ncbi:MAG: hypothetical protein ACOY93_13370 [Bacillota bacterium]
MRRSGTGALVLGGMMAAMAAALQLAPLYLPGVGLLLAMLSSLPMAVQAYRHPPSALLSYGAAVAVILSLSAQEAAIFAFTSGPFGLAVGYCHRPGQPGWLPWLGAALPLSAGLLCLAYLVGLPPLGPELGALSVPAQLGLYLGFALLYSLLWGWAFGALLRRLQRWAVSPPPARL